MRGGKSLTVLCFVVFEGFFIFMISYGVTPGLVGACIAQTSSISKRSKETSSSYLLSEEGVASYSK